MIEKVKASMGKYDNLLFRFKSKLYASINISSNNIKEVPIIINNFNRLLCLQQQISWLEHAGFKNIFIIDNFSSYPGLLEFYKQTAHKVFMLDRNVGFLSLWKTIIFQRFKNTYYVYTDPDIIPVENCPANVVEHFYALLQKYPAIDKVGFGLRIDDIPDYYPLKEKVINWEKKFWANEIENKVFAASIDTTFALYRPGAKGGSELKALRTGEPYIARHLSWYMDPLSMKEEDQYYLNHAGPSSSWIAELSGKERNIKY